MSYTKILEVLEAHAACCLDNEPERQKLAKALARGLSFPVPGSSGGRYLELVEDKKKGVLRIELTEEGRENAGEIYDFRRNHGPAHTLIEYLEPYLCNGWETLDDTDLRDLGALTGADLFLTNDAVRDEQGRLRTAPTIYWNPNYAVMDEVEELLEKGFVEFWRA